MLGRTRLDLYVRKEGPKQGALFVSSRTREVGAGNSSPTPPILSPSLEIHKRGEGGLRG